METFRALIKIAVTGTAMSTELPETGVPALDNMLGAMPKTSSERLLLAAAGSLAVYGKAGTEALAAAELPPGAEPDDWPSLSQRGAASLSQLLEGDLRTLLPTTLELMKEKRIRLPETLLPDFLDLKDDLRPCVIPVLGQRGMWLAMQNADWNWALEEAAAAPLPGMAVADDLSRLEQLWKEGDPQEREVALRRMRSAEPDRARAWLEETWKKDKADQRAAFLELLRGGLSPADIPFLEGIAKDRSQKIRNIRFLLLASLPGSSVTRDLKEHAAFLQLSQQVSQGGVGGLLKKLVGMPGAKHRMQVLAPEEPDAFWLEAGISVKPPQGIGPRAWLLQQMLSLIPLDFWQEKLEAPPEELIDAAGKTEWSLSILEGWSRSAIAMPGKGWLPALVAWWGDFRADDSDSVARGRQLRSELLPGLIAADPAQRSGLVEQLLNGDVDTALPWQEILKRLERPWPALLARLWLKVVRSALKQHGDEYHYNWLATLPLAAGALPDECLQEAAREWDLPEKQENETWGLISWRKALAGFSERIEIRRVISEEIHRLHDHNGGK